MTPPGLCNPVHTSSCTSPASLMEEGGPQVEAFNDLVGDGLFDHSEAFPGGTQQPFTLWEPQLFVG